MSVEAVLFWKIWPFSEKVRAGVNTGNMPMNNQMFLVPLLSQHNFKLGGQFAVDFQWFLVLYQKRN